MDRPKLGNDEDELLKIQQEFLASQTKPSASVVKKSEKRKSQETQRDVVHMDTLPPALPSFEAQPPKKSRFQAEREKERLAQSGRRVPAPEKNAADPRLDPEEMLDRKDRGFAAILSSIIERDTRNAAFTMPQQSTQGFPSVIKNSCSMKPKGSSQRQSLFAQQVAQRGVREFGVMVQEEAKKTEIAGHASSSSSMSCDQSIQQGHVKSNMVDGHGLSASQAEEEADSIHRENLTKLSEMSEAEILAERQQLLQSLDPSLVAFFKSKSKPGKTTTFQPAKKPSEKKAHPAEKKIPEPGMDVTGVPEEVLVEKRKDWVHMDTVECDKLEWMKDLPPPSTDDTKTGQQARFDFQGNVIPADADIPVNVGLHHHGEEPERAGYSIGELFQLARSTNVQQRVLALSTLGNVIQKAKDGALDDLIQTPIIPSVLEGGVVFLLRWACDDSVDAVVAAALSALCALLCNPADEAALDWVSSWYHGNCVPAMTPPATIEQAMKNKMEEDDDNKAEETDAEVVKRDLMEGLMSRMKLQERLFYLLDSRQPQAPTVVCILSILTRVAHHSTELAYQIARNTKLMNLIFHNFLPTSWGAQASGQKAVSSVYGRPLAAAMRLVGSLCQTGRHIAASLVSTYSLQNILTGYLSVNTSELLLSVKEADHLQKESLITWGILLSYGLTANIFLEMYEPLMDQMKDVMSRLSNNDWDQVAERDVHFMSALEKVLPVAAISLVKPGFSHSEGTRMEVSVSSCINWSHVDSLCPMVRLCCEQCLTHLAQHHPQQQKPSLQFPAACLNFMATFYNKWKEQSSQNAVDVMQQIEEFSVNSLAPFLKSSGFTSIVASLCSFSNVLAPSDTKRREVAGCLPELGCDRCEGRVPVIMESSPVGFLLSLCRLVHCLRQVHRDLSQQTAAAILSHKDVVSYLQKVTTCAANYLRSNHFTGMETLLQFYLIKLSTLLNGEQRPPMMHQLALDVMSRLQEGDEFLAHDLMTTVVFNADFIPEGREEELATSSMADLQISSRTHILKSATQEEITTTNSQLLREAVRCLPVIRGHYFITFAHMEGNVAKSRCRYQQLPQDTNSLMAGGWESSLMPQDWVFLPLVTLYNLCLSLKSGHQKLVESSSLPAVTSAVQWIFLLEMWRSRTLSTVSVALKISRLMCVFLGGDQLFLEKSVHPYLASLFRVYTTPRLLSAMNFEESLPGISFYDLYMALLEQFEFASFGDPVFGAFVLLPMQQCQSCLLRRAVWQERSRALRTLTFPVQEMLIDIDRFLNPDEKDPHLLQLYTRSLLSGTVRQCWSPVFFLVAVHHLNRFLFYTGDDVHQDLRQSLWDIVLKCPDKSLMDRIVHYKQVNTEVTDCMEEYRQLPANRQQVVSQHRHRLGL